VVLVKPQFEAGRAEAAKGRGVIRDPAVWGRCLEQVGSAFAQAGAAILGALPSPITGSDGNVEFFLHLRAHTAGRHPADLAPVVDQAVAALQG
jgi:23S rRNA (cytidine1920-2'-O)/16S rRNA (cytidine1409-2'-O)-methyltransferase